MALLEGDKTSLPDRWWSLGPILCHSRIRIRQICYRGVVAAATPRHHMPLLITQESASLLGLFLVYIRAVYGIWQSNTTCRQLVYSNWEWTTDTISQDIVIAIFLSSCCSLKELTTDQNIKWDDSTDEKIVRHIDSKTSLVFFVQVDLCFYFFTESRKKNDQLRLGR